MFAWAKWPRVRSERRDLAWAAVAIIVGITLIVGIVAALFDLVVHGNWRRLAGLPVGAVVCWWWGMGAWRRTRWGRVASISPQLRADS
jgi:hypothetical protein